MAKVTAKDSARVGAVRPSQMIHSYGVGSIVDLPNFSALVAGLDTWTHERTVIQEPRLLEAVQALLGPQVRALEAPPQLEETRSPFDPWAKAGVTVFPFPRWFRCTNQKCNLFAPIDTGLFDYECPYHRPHRARFFHTGCGTGNAKYNAVPARFVLACAAGHLDEFPWVEFVHGGVACTGQPLLKLEDVGQAARSTDQVVICQTCSKRRGLNVIFGPQAEAVLPMCRGRHPHLGLFEACDQQAQALVVGATNGWFAIQRTVLSIPDVLPPADAAVAAEWGVLQQVTSTGDLAMARKFNPDLAKRLAGISDDEVMAAIARKATDAPEFDPDLLSPEWRVLTGPAVNEPEILSTRHVSSPAGLVGVGPTVIADLTREVTALCGFTRIDSMVDADIEDLQVRRVPLTDGKVSWVPVAESRGEGLLIRLDEQRLKAWEQTVNKSDRVRDLRETQRRWRQNRGLAKLDVGLPDARFVLLHTLSHALVNQFALECGYTAASMRERIYSRSPLDGSPMAGVLIYTAAPDAEGTLGGLIALGNPKQLGRITREALARAELCSTDPFCSEHEPNVVEGTAGHGAACHSCLFLPETSCTHGNRHLDRSALVETFTRTDLAYFTK